MVLSAVGLLYKYDNVLKHDSIFEAPLYLLTLIVSGYTILTANQNPGYTT